MNWKTTSLGALAMLSLATAGVAAPHTRYFVAKPFPPYVQSTADGRAAGPMVDILNTACARLGWRCSIELVPWRRAFDMATTAQVDGIFPIVDSPERAKTFRLSPAVVQGRYVLMGKACETGSVPCQGAPPLAAPRTVAAYGPSDVTATLHTLLHGRPDLQPRTERDQLTVLRKLAAGRYGLDGLALVNETVARTQMADAGIRGLREIAEVKDLQYAYAFVTTRIDASEMHAFTETIRAMCREGVVERAFGATELRGRTCAAVPGRPTARVRHEAPGASLNRGRITGPALQRAPPDHS